MSLTSRPRPTASGSFFFNDTPTTEIYTLSLHDALPISRAVVHRQRHTVRRPRPPAAGERAHRGDRSEEHTSELQSQSNLVCRLLLEKKNPLRRHRGAASRTGRESIRARSPGGPRDRPPG